MTTHFSDDQHLKFGTKSPVSITEDFSVQYVPEVSDILFGDDVINVDPIELLSFGQCDVDWIRNFVFENYFSDPFIQLLDEHTVKPLFLFTSSL